MERVIRGFVSSLSIFPLWLDCTLLSCPRGFHAPHPMPRTVMSFRASSSSSLYCQELPCDPVVAFPTKDQELAGGGFVLVVHLEQLPQAPGRMSNLLNPSTGT